MAPSMSLTWSRMIQVDHRSIWSMVEESKMKPIRYIFFRFFGLPEILLKLPSTLSFILNPFGECEPVEAIRRSFCWFQGPSKLFRAEFRPSKLHLTSIHFLTILSLNWL
jgi:hypothetical protein